MAVAVDDGLIVPVIRDADSSRSTASTSRSPTSPNRARAEQAPARRLRRRDVHRRQHRLPRHEPRHADPQRARGRDRHDGGDHQAAGRRLDAGRRRHRDPADHEHGPRRRPPGQRRRRRRGAAARHQGLARVGRPGHARSTEPTGDGLAMRVVVTGGAGFIGGAVVARSCATAATRSSRSSAIRDRARVPRRSSARSSSRTTCPTSARLTARAPRAPTPSIHAAGSYRDRDHDGRARRDVGRQRRHDDAGPRRRRGGRRRRGSSTSRRSTCSATPTAGSSTRRTGATSREGFLSWYDETKYRAHEVAEQRIAAGAPIVIVDARARSTGPATTPRSARSSGWRYERQAAVPRRSTDVGIGLGPRRRPGGRDRRRARPRRGSASSYILAGDRDRARRGDRDRGRGSAASGCPRLRLPNGAPAGRWRRSAASIGQPNLARGRRARRPA